MTEKYVLALFDKYGALLKGHFKLSSGVHSEKYLQCALILQHPEAVEKVSKALAKRFSKDGIDFVIGPALGGIIFAYEAARALGVRGIFAEREGGKMTLRRNFSIEKGERALVVEDVVTTGGSTKEVMNLVRGSGGIVAGVGCVIDRSDGKIDFGAKFESLARLKIATHEEKDCPLCKNKVPIMKPGSRR